MKSSFSIAKFMLTLLILAGVLFALVVKTNKKEIPLHEQDTVDIILSLSNQMSEYYSYFGNTKNIVNDLGKIVTQTPYQTVEGHSAIKTQLGPLLIESASLISENDSWHFSLNHLSRNQCKYLLEKVSFAFKKIYVNNTKINNNNAPISNDSLEFCIEDNAILLQSDAVVRISKKVVEPASTLKK